MAVAPRTSLELEHSPPQEAPKRGAVKEVGGVTEDCPVLRPKSGTTGPLGIPYRTCSVWRPRQKAERIRPIL